jgi:mono/diheme cytochrome c family protein
MLVHPPKSIILFAVLVAITPAFAGGKAELKPSLAPAVPGFTRFYADAKANAVEGGHLLMGELQCARCHAPAADASLKMAPILDGVGSRVKVSYLRQFISDPHKTKPGTKMPDLFAGLNGDDKKAKVEALVHLLASPGTPKQVRADAKGIATGRDLYHKVGCVSCHGTRDAKGDQDVIFATSVPLGNLKAKYTISSIQAFLENPHQTRPTGRMPGLLTAKEASDVANYLMQGTASGPALNMAYAYYEGGGFQVLPDFTKVRPKATGDTIDFDLGVAQRKNDCAIKFDGFLKIDMEGTYTLHTRSDDGSRLWINGNLVVDNDGIHAPASKSGKVKLAKGMHKLTVGVFNAGGGFELSCEIEGNGLARQPLGPLVYLTEQGVKPKTVVDTDPDDFRPEPALIAKGKEVFVSMGCANCHQLNGEKKRMAAPALANLKLEAGCLDAAPKKGVPQYRLSAVQRTALQAALKKPIEKVDAKSEVVQTMARFNCYACHDRDKIGGVEENINKHFQTVQPEMGDEGRIPPSLTGVGAKLNSAYLKKILNEGSHDRPYMHTRMPKFGNANVGHLVALYASLDAAEPGARVEIKTPMAKFKSAGRDMVGSRFGCVKCHTFAGAKAEGVQGIDLAIMTQRLKKDWFHNYMTDPGNYRPGTRMPSSFPNGKTLLDKVLDGKAPTQIEAIWTYLADGKAAVLPAGMNSKSIPLVPTEEAIIYRNFIQGAGPRAIGVGFPEKAHYAFDANELRLAMIWQGAFMDARRHWTDRGVGFEPPMGDNILHLPGGAGFCVLSKADEAWPTKAPKELGYKFRGYRLSDDQRPTLLYSFNDIKIEDFPNAIETKADPAIRRTLTLTTENPIDKLYYRAAVADKIEADKDGWFRINDWRMRIESDQAPAIRRAGEKMELLVPVRFKGNSAKIVQEYVW